MKQLYSYSPFGAPLPGRTYNAMEDLNKVTVVEGPGGLTGWSTPNSSTSVSNDAVKVTFTTSNTAAVSMSKTFSTTASKHYRLSFNADAATYTNVSVEIVGYGGNALSSATLNTDVTHYQLDFTANDASTVIKVSLGTGTGTRTIYLDNVKLEEIKGDVKGYATGFNGQEQDNEVIGGIGLIMTAEYWEYDSRLGRRWNIDPIVYAWQSGYAVLNNSPIINIDPKGDTPSDGNGGDEKVKKGDKIITDDGKEIEASTDEAVITPAPSPSSIKQITADNCIKCHAGNDFLPKETARVAEEYAKLNHAGGQVDFPRSPMWDIVFGNRTYLGRQINSDGYLTDQMSPQIGAPDLIGGVGGAANRFNHIFGKSEHALGTLITKFGSEEAAFNAVQKAANQALEAGKLSTGPNGILPKVGEIINVEGMDVRLIGGRVMNGQVQVSSFSRKGL